MEKYIEGSVIAPKGFKAFGVHCGIRPNRQKNDLGIILSEKQGSAAAVYTQNKVKGAPITVTKNNLKNKKAQGVIVNSGNANTCNANGIEIAEEMCLLMEENFNINNDDVIVASTGVIGEKLSISPIKKGVLELKDKLVSSLEGSKQVAYSIMTTDTVRKEMAVEFQLDGKACRIGLIAKGSGMIHPNMATMLSFITTDCNITGELLEIALKESVDETYNMLSVDGDTSTNDMVSIIANGMCGNKLIDSDNGDFQIFKSALNALNEKMVKIIAKDGEGATKLLTVIVTGGGTINDSRAIAKSVCTSSLVKTAIFGEDANWGRILCAIGYAEANVDVTKVGVSIESNKGKIQVCEKGSGVLFSEEIASKILKEDEINISITLEDGNCDARAFGCDLSYDYVKINGDYRT